MSEIYIRANCGECDLVFSLSLGDVQSDFCIQHVSKTTIDRLQYAINSKSRFHRKLGQTSKGEGYVTFEDGFFLFGAESGIFEDDFSFNIRVPLDTFKVEWDEVFADFETVGTF